MSGESLVAKVLTEIKEWVYIIFFKCPSLCANLKITLLSHLSFSFSAQALHWKDEDGAEVSPFANIDKSAVIQECKVFHDSNFVKNHPKRCCQHITKLLYILTQGESLGAQDSMQVFFGVTKLFQSTDGNLRKSILSYYYFVSATMR